MKKIRLLGILVLILLMGNSCKTYKNLEKVTPKTESATMAEEFQKLTPGNRIKVFEKSGSIKILEFSSVNGKELKGVPIRENIRLPISILIDDIHQVKVRKTNLPLTIISIPILYIVGFSGFMAFIY